MKAENKIIANHLNIYTHLKLIQKCCVFALIHHVILMLGWEFKTVQICNQLPSSSQQPLTHLFELQDSTFDVI